MTRVKRGVQIKKRHKKVLKMAKGYSWGFGGLYRHAKNALAKAGMHAYEDRRNKKRSFRRLWIARINAALQPYGVRYSQFIAMLFDKDVDLDRKVLSQLAMHEPEVFKQIVEFVKK